MAQERNEIAEELHWDLTTIYPTDEDWEAALEAVTTDIEAAAAFTGHLLDSAESFLEITLKQLELAQKLERIYVYASMKNDQDTRVAKYQEFRAKASALYVKFSETFAFYVPEFMGLTAEMLSEFEAKVPQLTEFSHYFEGLFAKKAHVLSQKEEKLLAQAGEIFAAPSETFEVFDNADIELPVIQDENGQEVQLTHGNYVSFLECKDRAVREAAYQALYGHYAQYQHTYAKTLQTNVKVHNFNASAHNYKSAREAALSENFVPEEVYDVLVEAVDRHLPLLHRYIALRRQILDLPDLKMSDIYMPLSQTDYKFDYEAAVQKAQEVLSVFGDDYSARVKRAFDERWIDVEENNGKRSGAYSGGAYDTNAFMLLNWQGNLDALFTLVHEMGHSMHSTFTRENQPYVYGDYPIFLAEIASTTNENILTDTLLDQEKDDKTRFAILNNWLDGFKGTVYRQTQFAEFEHKIHEADAQGEVLTSEFMNQLYGDLNEKYYGLASAENPEIQYEWARIPHFYYNYYVFQYSTGFAAASYLAEKIVHGTAQDREAYLDYLKAGSSDYPLNVIAKAGVDMTKPDYLDAAFELFEKRLTELESLVAKGAYL
ncbi:oligoendopeptidase F [Lactovum odontotermitis]